MRCVMREYVNLSAGRLLVQVQFSLRKAHAMRKEGLTNPRTSHTLMVPARGWCRVSTLFSILYMFNVICTHIHQARHHGGLITSRLTVVLMCRMCVCLHGLFWSLLAPTDRTKTSSPLVRVSPTLDMCSAQPHILVAPSVSVESCELCFVLCLAQRIKPSE